MEHHPLLKELLQICSANNIEPSKAYTTFEVYLELSEVRKLLELEYHFNETLKTFYLSGKKQETDEVPDIYLPVMVTDRMTPEEMDSIQENLCQSEKKFHLIIRDRDSSSTCYEITKGLVKPDSPLTCKTEKEMESKKYQFDRFLQNNKKALYSKALKSSKSSTE